MDGGPRLGREEVGREGGAMRLFEFEEKEGGGGRRGGAFVPPEARWWEFSAGNIALGGVGVEEEGVVVKRGTAGLNVDSEGEVVVVNIGTGGLEMGFLSEGGGGGGIAFRSRSAGGASCVICGISAFSHEDSSSL